MNFFKYKNFNKNSEETLFRKNDVGIYLFTFIYELRPPTNTLLNLQKQKTEKLGDDEDSVTEERPSVTLRTALLAMKGEKS